MNLYNTPTKRKYLNEFSSNELNLRELNMSNIYKPKSKNIYKSKILNELSLGINVNSEIENISENDLIYEVKEPWYNKMINKINIKNIIDDVYNKNEIIFCLTIENQIIKDVLIEDNISLVLFLCKKFNIKYYNLKDYIIKNLKNKNDNIKEQNILNELLLKEYFKNDIIYLDFLVYYYGINKWPIYQLEDI